MSRRRRTGLDDPGTGLRDAIKIAVENLEDERLHSTTRVSFALGVLRSALLRYQRRDPRARTRSTD
ncbi:MAG: hypothetical protein JWM47_4556 [Acidimicrobiales bacterium]|nr:hypothetical protein [Acidimicrobiales bacterium]